MGYQGVPNLCNSVLLRVIMFSTSGNKTTNDVNCDVVENLSTIRYVLVLEPMYINW